MTTPLHHRAALAVLAFAIGLACARNGDETLARDTGDTTGTDAGAPSAPSPAALASLEGPCPTGGATPRTGSRGTFENELDQGEYLVLRANGTVIDSIDALFGAHVVGRDSVVFIPIWTDTTGSPPHAAAIGHPVLCAAGERVLLARELPGFDPIFSSPTIRDSTIWYWGMQRLAEPGNYFLTARRHHFPTNAADSLPLDSLAMYTDARHHLRPPRIVGDSVIYETGERRWVW